MLIQAHHIKERKSDSKVSPQEVHHDARSTYEHDIPTPKASKVAGLHNGRRKVSAKAERLQIVRPIKPM